MGNDTTFKCGCSFGKEDKSTAQFDDINYNNKINNEEENEDMKNDDNDSQNNSQLQKTLSNFCKLKSLKSNKSNSENNNFIFSKRTEDLKRKKYILYLQSVYKGHYFRTNYPYLRQEQIKETNKLIQDLTAEYSKLNLKRAESLYPTKYDLNGWKLLYNKDNIENKEIKNILSFKYGQIFHTNLLILNQGTSIYRGFVDINNNLHGYGILLLNDGSKYEGYFNNNDFTGWGRYIDSEGTLYEGLFIKGKLNGKGIKKILSGNNTYIGDFVDNEKNGNGKEETNEKIYEGMFKDDKKNGNGKIVFKLYNDTYEGEFKDNDITGFGFYTWANKDTYKGTFISGQMHGKGLYKWPGGQEYYGEYEHNIKQGNGIFKWKNGKIYEGQFKNGKPHGFGKLKLQKKEFDVEFKEGKLVTNIKNLIKENKFRTISISDTKFDSDLFNDVTIIS